MNMTASERGFAPELEKYLRDSFSTLANNSTIVNNLMGCGNMKQQQARHALMWETDPFVWVMAPTNRKCANFVGNVKCAFDAATNSIEVDDTWFENFLNTGGMLTTPKGKLVPNIRCGLAPRPVPLGKLQQRRGRKKGNGLRIRADDLWRNVLIVG